MKINLNTFYGLVHDKYLTVQKHDNADLLIWNYTPRAQFERYWTDETMMARGLITTLEGEIVARPFRKFFNLSEHTGEDSKLPSLPMESFEVFDKLDGSLGILYFIEDKPFIATRGSFTSDQALWATKTLWQKYSKVPFDKHGTYLFEIIYPENRIVVDYKGKEDLFLLSAFVTETGEEFDYDLVNAFAKTWKIPVVKRFDGLTDISEITNIQKNNSEGFVIRYTSGVRAKFKFEEYVRLHRLLTGVNAKTIWDLLRNDQDFSELLDKVPDEYYEWVKSTKAKLEAQFKEINEQTVKDMNKIMGELETLFGDGVIINEDKVAGTPELRKEFAKRASKTKYAGIVFAMLSHRPWKDIIWKMIRPVASKPFREDIDV